MMRDNESPWSYQLVRTRDGARRGYVEPANPGSWARRLDTKSTGTHVFHIGTNPEVWARMRPARRTLVVCYENEPVYAGIIWSATYNRSAGTVTLNHEDIWSLWERRLAAPRAEMDADDGSYMAARWVRYSGLSRRTHAKRILQLGMRAPEPRDDTTQLESYALPVILPEDETGGWGFTHRVYNFATVSDALERVRQPGGAMQIDFPMQWTFEGNFRWQLQVSHSSSRRSFLHVGPERSPVIDLSLTHDMSEYFSESHATGDGQAEDTVHRMRWLGTTFGDTISLATETGHSGVETGDDLNDILDGLRLSHRTADVQIDVTVALGGDYGVSPLDYTLGQTITLRVTDDPVIPDGEYSFMLIGYAPVSTYELRLELAPIDGFTGFGSIEPSMHYRNLNTSRIGDQASRIHRAEKRIIFPAGGATVAATTRTTEDT